MLLPTLPRPLVAVTLRTTRGDDVQPEDRRRRWRPYRVRTAGRGPIVTNSNTTGRPA